MPSPVGHALAGAAAGWILADRSHRARHSGRRELWRRGLLFGSLGVLPDIDLLFGAHSGPTHGIGAALIAGLAVLALTRQGRFGSAAAAAYATHTLLDWLGSDTSTPIGIMALWPFSREHYLSDLHFFYAITRRYQVPGFWQHNLRALAWELLILLPIAFLAFVARCGERQGVARRAPRNGRTEVKRDV